MRLLRNHGHEDLTLVEFDDDNVPPYATLSHTWGPDTEEVSFRDVIEGTGKHKTGYNKIQFCKEQAAADGLQYFWMDTCCIDKSSSTELSEAINSMFRWYKNAAKCYVYLSDVSTNGHATDVHSSPSVWDGAFQSSRWFNRGWTLQELIAPDSVQFFSQEGTHLGSKSSFEQKIHEITDIAVTALRGAPLTEFKVGERMSWARHRETRRLEDKAYSLLGIFDIQMPLLYGEGREKAFIRLQEEIDKISKRKRKWDAYLEPAQDETNAPDLQQQFLESLFFSEITSRQEQIPEAFKETCRWIFDTSIDERQRRDQPLYSFHEWLRSGKGIYWISGKPGSGKSTLMKFIVNEELTEQILHAERGNQDLLIISFFFWSAGTTLQRSAAGLLRSLLYQIARQCPDLVKTVNIQSGESSYGVESSTRLRSAWTERRLLSLLGTFIGQIPAHLSLCAFVDGLDEFVGDEDLLLDMVRLFSRASQCKICVSSRPEQTFRQEFQHCPRLRIQDFNHADIHRMATGKLTPVLEKHLDTGNPSYRSDNDYLVNDLVAKASGVFLWLDLMIRDLTKGAKNGDTIEQLRSRLDRTPATIEGLYTHILENLDPIYHEERLRYFAILLAANELEVPVTLLHLICAQGEPWEHAVRFDLDYFTTARIRRIRQKLENRLFACCGGLIDVSDSQDARDGLLDGWEYRYDGDEDMVPQEGLIMVREDRAMDYIHRTAMEYIRKRYRDLLGHESLMEAKTYLARGRIGYLAFLSSKFKFGKKYIVNSMFGSSFVCTMKIICTLGQMSAEPAVSEASVSIQTDLTNRAFRILQSVYSYNHRSARECWSDARFIADFLDLDDRDLAERMVKDQLSAATYYGCNDYLRSQPSIKNIGKEHATNLLHSILPSIASEFAIDEALEQQCLLPKLLTMQTVLQYPLNPQEPYMLRYHHDRLTNQRLTLWGKFLSMIPSILLAVSDPKSGIVPVAYEECIIGLVEAFLSHGADLDTRIHYQHYVKVGNSITSFGSNILSRLKAHLQSAGAAHREEILFLKQEVMHRDGPLEAYHALWHFSDADKENLGKIFRSVSSTSVSRMIEAYLRTEDIVNVTEAERYLEGMSYSFLDN
ncbi:MAG: hypothetical protein Q9222_001187 [Ikaeria aurantiellina]